MNGKFRKGWSKDHETKDAERTTNKGPEGTNAQCRSSPSLPSHLITIQACDHRGCLSWYINKNGGGRTPIHGPIIDACQHDDCRGGVQVEGCW